MLPNLTFPFSGKCSEYTYAQKETRTHAHTLLTYCISDLRALLTMVQVLREAALLDNVAKKQESGKVFNCPGFAVLLTPR